MQFEFNNQLMPQNLIDIDNVGEFAIEASNDEGYYYYLVVRTSLGISAISTCGPVLPDVDLIPGGFKIEVNKLSYKEDKIGKAISYFLNDSKKGITSAKLIEIEDALKQFKDVTYYISNFDREM